MKKRIIVGLIVGILIVSFGLAAESQLIPFNEYRYKSPVLTFLFALINLPVVVAVPIMGVTSNGPIMAMFFIWWFIIGFFCTWVGELIFGRMRKRSEEASETME